MTAQDDVRKARALLESAEAKLKGLDRIRVPEGIRFTADSNEAYKDQIGLLFNKDKQVLTYNQRLGMWTARCVIYRISTVPLYLTPCKRSDLKAGEWAYSCDGDTDFTDRAYYHLILSSQLHAYTADGGVNTGQYDYKHWYKVTT